MNSIKMRWVIAALVMVLVTAADGYFYSPGLGALQFDSALMQERIMAWSLLVCSALAVVLVVYWAATPPKKQQILLKKGGSERMDYLRIISELPDKCFISEKLELKEDAEIFQEKTELAQSLIEQCFGSISVTGMKYEQILESSQRMFDDYVRQIINRMRAFNYRDYVQQVKDNDPERLAPYEDHIQTIHQKLKDLDTIMIHVDDLTTALLRLCESGSLKNTPLPEMEALKELVANTRYYQKA